MEPVATTTDDTPLFSHRQLQQSIGQFVIAFVTALGVLLASGGEVTWRQVAGALIQAAIFAGGVLGFSYVPTVGKKD